MFRQFSIAVAVCGLLAAPAFAGGSGSSGSIPVRIKNVGRLPVGVSALSGSASASQLLSSGRILAANGISQFSVRPGEFTAAAAKPSAPTAVNKIREFSTRTFKTIYLQAQQDGTTATLVGAPAGVKF